MSSGPSPLQTLTSHPARRRGMIALFLLLTAAAAPGLLRLRIDDSPERFFVHDARALERFRQLELRFSRDRAVRVVLSGPGLWTREGLAFAGAVEERVQALHGVIGTAGVLRHHRWHLDRWPPPDPARFRDTLIHDRVDRGAGWVSDDGSTLTVLAGLYRLSAEQRRATLAAIEAVGAAAPPGVAVRVAGLATVDRALDAALRRMAGWLFPALVAVAVLLLAAVFRGLAGVALPLAQVAVSETVVLGAMGYAGQPLDFVLIVLVPLLFVIVLATAVHVLCFHRRLRLDGLDPAAAAVATYRVKTWPVIWTGVTTAAGFGSLAVSGVPPVRALGLWAAFGIAFATFAMLTFFPALLASGGGAGRSTDRAARGGGSGGDGRFERAAEATGRRLAAAATERPVAVALLFTALGLLAAAGLPRLRVETDAVAYLPAGSPARHDLRTLEQRGIGAMAASLVLHAEGDAPPFDGPEALRRQAALAGALRREPLVLGALSAGDLVEDVAGRLGGAADRPGPDIGTGGSTPPREPAGPGERPSLAALAAGKARIAEEPDLHRMLGFLATSDGRWARITLLVPARGEEVLEPLFGRVEAAARAAFPDAEVWVTGQYPLVLAAQKSLLRTMILSLSMTALCVALIFRLVLGSLSLTLRALVPNLWPVLVVVGTMGWLGLPVESSTVAIASIVLGLAVDDTLHSLGSFRRLAQRSAPREAAVATLGETAGAHALTSVTLALGFGVCGLSALPSVARFGALSALAILAALAADLVLVPLLLARAPAAAVRRLLSTGAGEGSAGDPDDRVPPSRSGLV